MVPGLVAIKAPQTSVLPLVVVDAELIPKEFVDP